LIAYFIIIFHFLAFMNDKFFSIYRSSAGSGKTRTLAKEYLLLALRFRTDYYKHILAVTFTNKATLEMKSRVLTYLDKFAKGQPDSLADELTEALGIDGVQLQLRAQELQSLLLHRYSDFSISTIDSFFQKIIRSFTREAGLAGDFRLEIDQDEILEEVINNLINELGTNKELTEWVIAFASENLENDRAWDIRSTLVEFAREIFREEFRNIEDSIFLKTSKDGYFKELKNHLQQRRYKFLNIIRGVANECLALIHNNNWTVSDFKYDGGAYNFLLKVSQITSVATIDEKFIGKRPRKEFQEATNWGSDKSAGKKAIDHFADGTLIKKLNGLLDYRDKSYKEALSAEIVLASFNSFGLLADISRKLREYKEENNIMLLADAPKFLDGIIQDSDTPFIYEKVGSFYRNYLIDEFQDTSWFQWKNFKPLIINSLDQGYPCVIVGDVKQSIYRWRGGDLRLLQEEVEKQIGKDRVAVKALDSNFRSASVIVEFNNAFFKQATSYVEGLLGKGIVTHSYEDVAQQTRLQLNGIVSINFINETDKTNTWKSLALDNLVKRLETLQEAGIKLDEIAILVRKNNEGQEIADYLLQYKHNHPQSPFSYEVTSTESLRLDNAISINILVSAMTYLLNPDDLVARGQLSYDFNRLRNTHSDWHHVFSITDKIVFEKKLPQPFVKNKDALRKLSLLELTEVLIEVFELGSLDNEVIYLQSFQDIILEFMSQPHHGIADFLEWWSENRTKKSVQGAGATGAAQIYTIHKSKGLQFKHVIIPFCNWELDHLPVNAPLLWTQTEAAPFTEFTHVPVRYQTALEDTIFKKDFLEEKTRYYLDNINLLYVTLTRAERGLYITAPHPDMLRQKNAVASLLFNVLSSSEAFKENWNDKGLKWENGLMEPAEYGSQEVSGKVLTISSYTSAQWRSKLLLGRQPENFFRNVDFNKDEHKAKGVKLHTIFSRIDYAVNCESALRALIHEGFITQSEAIDFRNVFEQLLSNETVASWFITQWKVKTEAKIIVPGKGDSRVDRLLLNDRQAIVIDYKTGSPKIADQQQVKEYITILYQMGFVQVNGFLLYLSDQSVVEVVVGKVSAKKDTDQLTLGI
jgi:ATP-dependent helicase/nuclease subunit A